MKSEATVAVPDRVNDGNEKKASWTAEPRG